MSERVKEIFDGFLMKVSKRGGGTYWLYDIKEGNRTPQVVIGRDGENGKLWKAYVFSTGKVLCGHQRTRKGCASMAAYNLANIMAEEEMRQYHNEACAIHELYYTLSNISVDDNRDISSYSLEEIVKEAEWVRMNIESYKDECGDDFEKLNEFINKWKV